jgi:hypothetical protein
MVEHWLVTASCLHGSAGTATRGGFPGGVWGRPCGAGGCGGHAVGVLRKRAPFCLLGLGFLGGTGGLGRCVSARLGSGGFVF